jgi:hypothetical protein
MATNITYTDGTPVLAKDISGSKHARTILDETLAQAKTSRTHRAWTLIPTADGTDQIIIVAIR